MSSQNSTHHIYQSLFVNAAIAAIKGVAAFFTGSGSMLAETIHSAADCGNQALLLLGVKRAERPPDATHPLGYGRSLYFWSFIVALLLFTGGGVFSIYEGLHKMHHPEPITNLGAGVSVLVVSLLLEGWSTLSNIRALNQRRGSTPFFRYLQESKDSDLVVVFAENSAASVGLALALLALVASLVTNDPWWDGVGSLLIGGVLVAVALFLAVEVMSLLVGEAAAPEIEATVRRLATTQPHFKGVLNLITMQQGPGEVLVALKVDVDPDLSAGVICTAINEFEVAIRNERPEVRWVFVEPDLRREMK